MLVQILRLKCRKEKDLLKHFKKECLNSFFINPIQENRSLGPCSIPVKILQKHVDVLKQTLTYLINLSFQQGIFPEALKTARVTPIFKKDHQLPSIY